MKSCVMYANVRAEMARKGLTIMDIAKGIGMNRDTLSRKLSGRSCLNLDEAFCIQMTYFPDVPIRVLFKENADKEAELNTLSKSGGNHGRKKDIRATRIKNSGD